MQAFDPNLSLLQPGLLAPLPLAPNPRPLLAEAFRAALRGLRAPAEVLEPAAMTGGGIVHALQEFVLACNRLVESESPDAAAADAPPDGEEDVRPALAQEARRLVWASRDLVGAGNAAYALLQAVEKVPGRVEAREAEGFERHKGLATLLEARLESLGLPSRMDPVRFAILQVHLDELYDHAGVALQRFYRTLRETPADFAAFVEDLARTLTGQLIPDYLLGSGAAKEKTGLLDLLPELEREFL